MTSLVVTLTGLPGVGKTTVARLVQKRLDGRGILVSEHDSALVTEVNAVVLDPDDPESHFGIATGLAYVLSEYELAVRFQRQSRMVLIRDRGVEDTRLVVEEAVLRGRVPTALLEMLSNPYLLHSDLLVLLEADLRKRQSRVQARHNASLYNEAARRFEQQFGKSFADRISGGAPVSRVDANVDDPGEVAAAVYELIVARLEPQHED